jgi:probable rRNA maturation factor
VKVSISNQQRKIRVNLRQLKKDSLKALRLLNLQRAELSILLAGAKRTKELNLKYRGVNRTTDVLSFPIYESPDEFPADADFLIGDIVINPSQALIQAKEHGVTFKEELRRLLVHGLLHLLGYDHEKNTYQRRKMIKKETELLEKLEES